MKEYRPGSAFTGVVGRTVEESAPAWPEPNRARDGAPNVLFIVADDLSFSAEDILHYIKTEEDTYALIRAFRAVDREKDVADYRPPASE